MVPHVHFDMPDLTQASTIGLCLLLDALQEGGDALFAPCRSPNYPADVDKDVSAKARFALLELILEIEEMAERELLDRPVPDDGTERAIRARVLVNRHMMGFGDSAFEGSNFSDLWEAVMLLPPTLTDLADQLSVINHLNTALHLAAGQSSDAEIDALGALSHVIADKLKVAIATLEDIRRQGQNAPVAGR